MGDGCGEPFAPYKVIVATVPASQDEACEAHSAFSERPSRARLRAGNPAQNAPRGIQQGLADG